MNSTPEHLPAFIAKMEKENLPGVVIDTFAHYYRQVVSGKTGLISDRDIRPLDPENVKHADRLDAFEGHGRKMVDRAVMIVLNGGLGTSMGLTGTKSLLEVKEGKSFLEIIVAQAARSGARLALMNSFSTHAETRSAIDRLAPADEPMTFLQHKFPKIFRKDLSPAKWPKNPGLEWNPPGHGDIYTALYTSGMLEKLLAEGVIYAFISNSDNLGATLDLSLLGYFAQNRFPFMMEVARRTPADLKGGHLARHRNGRLVLREIAQCPEDEIEAFQDIERYRFFNTNSLWINLAELKRLIEEQKMVRLPMILNPKALDPRDADSPPVYQIESAMGAAVSLFDNAAAVGIPDHRFFPVKKCSDLMALQSDCFTLTENDQLIANPARRLGRIKISLDPEFYGKIDSFYERFPEGIPSLVDCQSLTIRGDVRFEADVTISGRVTLENTRSQQAVVERGTMVDNDLKF